MADNRGSAGDDIADGDGNMWSSMLKEARKSNKSSNTKEDSVVYLMGNPKSGKTSLLSKFANRVSSKLVEIPEYIADFSYVNVKNKYNLENLDQVIARMGIWQIADPNHAGILPHLACDPEYAAFVICLDFGELHSTMENLKKWLKAYEQVSTELLKNYSDEKASQLKTKISKYCFEFEDATVPKPDPVEEKKEEPVEEEEVSLLATSKKKKKKEEKAPEPEVVEKKFDPKIPVKNFGIPLLVVGLKGDSFERVGDDNKFGYVLRRLRQECLKYGATLIYSSAIGQGINTDVIQDHVNHRLHDLPLLHKPQTTGKCNQWQVHIPAGYDEESKINSSSIKDGTSMADVFDYHETKKERKQEKEVTAKTDQEFFQSLRGKLGSQRRSDYGRGKGKANKNDKDKAVKSFFKNLLTEDNS